MENPQQQPKRRRVVTACAECHRRKQKCDRQKPCNVCLARNVPEKCCYGDSSPQTGEPLPKSTGKQDEMGYSALEGTNAFSDLKKLLEGDNFFRAATSNRNDSQYADEAEAKFLAFLTRFPAEHIMQELLDVYFAESNWFYPILERPFFDELFVQWRRLKPAATRYTGPQGVSRDLQYFAALLFQVMALGLQFILPDAKCLADLQVANATTSDRLSRQYSEIAMEIMVLLGRHDTTITAVQTDFLRGVWLKNCSRGTEAWHALHNAIIQAQEIGLHRQAEIRQSSCLEETLRQLWFDEHKRRIWVMLFVWDGFMAWVLGRPRSINISDCDIRTPLDCDMPAEPSKKIPTASQDSDGTPSFFSSTLIQYELGKKIHEMRELSADRPYPKDYNIVWTLHKQVLQIVGNCPKVMRHENPDTTWDERVPQLPKKREQVWSLANNIIMVLHRPHMATHVESRKAAVHAALTILDSQQRFFELSSPHHYKLFGLTFYTIDASIMLSAIVVMYPPKDHDVIARIRGALQKAVNRLSVMARSNPTASSGAQIVRRCYEKVQDVLKAIESESSGTVVSSDTTWSGATLADNLGTSPELTSASQQVEPSAIGFAPELGQTLALPSDDFTSTAFWDNTHTFDSSYWLNHMNQIPDLTSEDDLNNETTWESLLL